MPGKVKVKVLAGRNLPVMDRGSDTTDAFVEIKFGGVTHKTDVCRKSLNPHWNNSDWYRFEVDDSELQDEPLQLRLMDHDTYSANDAIGKVVVSLAPLLSREPTNTSHRPHHHSGTIMSGWIPVFDTMHGIRGELNIIVKVDLFTDFNKFRQSSCGVQFFHCPMIPPGYQASVVHGFVEELIVNADPEYQWIDKIRTPRASNEARQVAFVKLSNQVQRRVGLKAAELGANAVVGYMQTFDLEGEAGVVARAVGTAVTIVRTFAPPPSLACSQQQLQKYIEFLTTDNDSYSNLNQYFQSHREQMFRMLSIMSPNNQSWSFNEDQEGTNDNMCNLEQAEQVKRQLSIQSLFGTPTPVCHSGSAKSLPILPVEAISLHNLLTQEDARFQNSSAIKRGLMNLNKKVAGLKPKRLHKQTSDDQISLKSTTSEASRLNLSDIKTEFKKLKKAPIFRRSKSTKDNGGGGMASVLVRSVFHVHSSLACIAETQDSTESPTPTLRSKSDATPLSQTDHLYLEPNIVIDAVKQGSVEVTEQPFVPLEAFRAESENNVVEMSHEGHELRPRRTSESCPTTPAASVKNLNLLTLPDTASDLYGSDTSVLSGDSTEPFSSSDDESENYGLDEDQPLSTVSAVVKSVLEHRPNPEFIAHMEEKLDYIAKHPTSDYCNTDNLENEITIDAVDNETRLQEGLKLDNRESTKAKGIVEAERGQEKANMKPVSVRTPPTKPIETSFVSRFHLFSKKSANSNSISLPSSPVERTGSFMKRQWSKLSRSHMAKSISHCSLYSHKHKGEVKNLDSPNVSGVDLKSLSESHHSAGKLTVLGSPLMSYADLLSLHNPNADDGHAETTHGDESNSGDVNMYIGSEPASRMSYSAPASPTHLTFNRSTSFSPAGRHHHNSPSLIGEKGSRTEPTSPTAIKPSSLVESAMRTMLMDRIQTLIVPTPDIKDADEQFFSDVNTKLEEHQNELNTHRKLVRQDSLHSISDESYDPSRRASEHDSNHRSSECLNRFGLLETIPSLPETISFDLGDAKPEGVNETPLSDPTNSLCDGVVDSNEATEVVETLTPDTVCRNSHAECSLESDRKEERSSPKHTRAESYGGKDGGTAAQAGGGGHTTLSPPSGANVPTSTAATTVPVGIHRRSSDSDLSITPKGGSLTMASITGGAILRPSMNPNNLDLLDYPFLTMTEFPPGFIIHLGGAVNARSVKLIDGGSSEGNSRAAWWAELRTELRAHARALRCTAVLGYSEAASICDDICVMSVSGTAAVINLEPASFVQIPTATFNATNVSGSNARVLAKADSESESTNRREVPVLPEAAEREMENNSDTSNQQVPKPGCSIAHVPYNHQTMPYQANVDKCSLCKRSRVPKLLICSIELPQALAVTGRGCLVSAAAARIRRAPPNGEPGARDISDQLPFLEYELHRLLIAKLRVHGMNAIFGVKTTIAAGERMVVALVTGTGVFISALPPPRAPDLRSVGAGGESSNNETLVELQRALDDALAANRAVYELDSTSTALPSCDSDEDLPSLDLAGDMEACILEVDDAEDVEMARSLTEPRAPKGIHAVTTQSVPGLPVRAAGSSVGLPHTFTQLWRARLPGQPNAGAATAVARHVHRLLQSVYYKLRRMTPCAVCNLKFQLVLPEVDEIQLLVTGVAISVSDSTPLAAPPTELARAPPPRLEEASEMIFSLDEEEGSRDAGDRSAAGPNKSTGDGRNLAGLVQNAGRACGVSLTPLALVEGARLQRPVSALRLLFVRETTSVRELGGLSGFLHTFITEVLAVVRAYTTALGGNALASFYITELMLQDNPHKNQGQCLLSVGGDVVQVTY